ncbi:hypothetical protein TNCV_4314751 [Trichonephila clavipes]|nr:hypothetical protein TNCV_4314751 [Trichonephila clavipes]
MMPTWIYRQDFAKFSFNRHYKPFCQIWFMIQHCIGLLEIQKSTTRGLQESKPKLSAGTPGGEKIRHSDSDS